MKNILELLFCFLVGMVVFFATNSFADDTNVCPAGKTYVVKTVCDQQGRCITVGECQ